MSQQSSDRLFSSDANGFTLWGHLQNLVSLGAAKLVNVTGFSNVAGIMRCVAPETLQRHLGASWLVAALEVWLAVICMTISLLGLPLGAPHACAYSLRSGLLESTDFDFVFDFVVFEIDLTPVADVAALHHYAAAATAVLEAEEDFPVSRTHPAAYGLRYQTLPPSYNEGLWAELVKG